MDSREERVRKRAYELWEQAGRLHGQHDEHWDQASRELAAERDGDDPVPADAIPPRDADTTRSAAADQDRLTPAKAAAATMREPTPARGAASEGSSRKPL